jgi:hypothetical protein
MRNVKCKNYSQPMTNRDMLASCTNAELATWVACPYDRPSDCKFIAACVECEEVLQECASKRGTEECPGSRACLQCVVEWLESPYENPRAEQADE